LKVSKRGKYTNVISDTLMPQPVTPTSPTKDRERENKRAYYARNKERLKKYFKEYYRTHQEQFRAYNKQYQRNHTIRVWKGGTLRGNKRVFPEDEGCELCGFKAKRLEYHHWDDSDLERGVWLCGFCHRFAEWVDRGLVPKYLELKSKIESFKS